MLYRVASVVVYGGPLDPRISRRVWRCSDTSRLGRIEEFAGLRSLQVPRSIPPEEWLREALEQLR